MEKKQKMMLITAICSAGLFLGWVMADVFAPAPPVVQHAANEPKASSQKNIVSGTTIDANTRLIIRYSYGGCGHYQLQEEPLPASWVGKQADDISLSGKLFETFENNILYFAKISQGKCDRHFVIRAEQGVLVVVYQNDPSRIRDQYEFLPSLLPKDVLQQLQEGIYVESEEELTSFLEDYCS